MRADSNYSILDRIVRATQVDTILHTHLIVDSTEISDRALHEINVIGTMNLLAAAGAAGSPVRKVIVKSSTLMYGSNYKDPYFFRETMPRTRPPRTRVERSLLDAAAFVRDFAIDNPHMTVTKLRFSNVLGDDIVTTLSKALRLPVVPEIFGFDPRLQFTHEDDVTGALLHATTQRRARHLQHRRRRRAAVERGVHDRREATLRAATAAHQLGGRAAAHDADRRSPARGAQPAALRPWGRQQPVQAHRLPLPVQHRGDGRTRSPAASGSKAPWATRTRRTSSSGTSRRSSGTRPRWSAPTGPEVSVPLHVERRGRVGILTLDDPERRNALTQEIVDAIIAAVATFEDDDGVGAIVVTGAPPAFCSGADVSALTGSRPPRATIPATCARSTPGSCASSTAASRRSRR